MELFFLLVLFGMMAFALISGFPVAFALPGAAIVSIGLAAATGLLLEGDPNAYFTHGEALQWLSAGVTNFRGVYWEPERDTLIAIPLFIFMGIMLQRSKIAEDLLVTMAQLFGPIPGGLGISVVFVGALLAATTGIVGATVVAMGLISLPAMMRAGYSPALASGTIAASGTLGQIIPPSVVLIILADQLSSSVDQASGLRKEYYKAATGDPAMPSEFDVGSTSAGDLFLGAIIPGLVLVGLYMLYIMVLAILRPSLAPAMPYEGKRDAAFWRSVVLTLFPPLALIILVLGSILVGVATVNQAGAVGAAGAMIMASYRLRQGARDTYLPAILAIASVLLIAVAVSNFDTNIRGVDSSSDVFGITLAAIGVIGVTIALIWATLRLLAIENTLYQVMVETAKATALVFIILIGAAMLTAAFRAFGGEDIVRGFLNSLPGGFWTQFFFVMLVAFILGFFIDFIEIAVVMVPIVAPILLSQPDANITAVWLGVMLGVNLQTSFLTPPFGFALFYLRGVASAAIRTIEIYKGVVPFIALQLLGLLITGLAPWTANYIPARTSLTAETAPPPKNPRLLHCVEQYLGERFATDGAAIDAAIATARGIDLASLPEKRRTDLAAAFESAAEARTLFAAVEVEAAKVIEADPAYRAIHVEARSVERRILERQRRLARMEAGDPGRAEVEAAIVALQAQIPAEFAERRAAFVALQTAERTARVKFRRAADSAYDPVLSTLAALQGLPALEAAASGLAAAKAAVSSDVAAAADLLAVVQEDVAEVEGASAIRSALGKAVGALGAEAPDAAAAIGFVDEAAAALEAEIAWRKPAAAAVLAPLEAYDATVRDTIGLRSLQKMPRNVALDVAACASNHRDIELFF